MSKKHIEKALDIILIHRDYIISDVVSEWKNIEKEYKFYHQMVRSVYLNAGENQGQINITNTINPKSSYQIKGVFDIDGIQVNISKDIEIPKDSSIFIPRTTIVSIDGVRYDFCKEFLHSDFSVLEDIVIGIVKNLEEKHLLDKINTLIEQNESSLKILKTLANDLSSKK